MASSRLFLRSPSASSLIATAGPCSRPSGDFRSPVMSRSSRIGASRSASCQVPASIQAFASSAVRRIAAPHARSSAVTRAMCARRRSLTCAHVGNPELWRRTISEDDVVDQSGLADPHGADGCIAVAYVIYPLKGVGIHRREITRREPRHSFEHPPACRLECARPSFSPAEGVAHCEKGFRQNERELPVLRREVSVPARHGQAIRLPHGGRDKNSHGKIEIADHGFHDRGLLEILLAENSHVGHHDVEEFGDYSENALEVMRTYRPFPFLSYASGVDNHDGSVLRVHVFPRRSEQEVHAPF